MLWGMYSRYGAHSFPITERYNNQCPVMFYFFTNLCSCHLEIEQPIWLQSYVCHAFLLAMVGYPMVLAVACSDGKFIRCRHRHGCVDRAEKPGGCRNWEYGTCGMNSKHPQDIHGHLQRAKVCFFTIRIFPNISEHFRIFPNQNFFLFRISGKPCHLAVNGLL